MAFRRTRSCSSVAIAFPMIPLLRTLLCHRRDKTRSHIVPIESARIGIDAGVLSYSGTGQCSHLVIARRSSPRVEHWGRRLLLCIALTPASPRGDVFVISPLAERNFWSRTRARSYERELIAQPSSTTSCTRRCSFAVRGLRPVPQPHIQSVLEGARKLLFTLRCPAPCTRPRARSTARSRASLPDHLWDDPVARSRLLTLLCSRRRPSVLTDRLSPFDAHVRTHYTQGLRFLIFRPGLILRPGCAPCATQQSLLLSSHDG